MTDAEKIALLREALTDAHARLLALNACECCGPTRARKLCPYFAALAETYRRPRGFSAMTRTLLAAAVLALAGCQCQPDVGGECWQGSYGACCVDRSLICFSEPNQRDEPFAAGTCCNLNVSGGLICR